jgi:hypothetical protein
MYRDDGESISPHEACGCAWLSYELVIDSRNKEHHATLDISLEDLESSASSLERCSPPSKGGSPEKARLLWPVLGAVKVLGWHLPLKAPGAVVELSRYCCAESNASDVWTIPEDGVEWGKGHLLLPIPAGPDLNSLTRGSKISVKWVAADRQPGVALS